MFFSIQKKYYIIYNFYIRKQIRLKRNKIFGGNMKKVKYLLVLLLTVSLMCQGLTAFAVNNGAVMELDSKSACLMEAKTGTILYENNADEHLEPASVTKVMSVLLIYEALNDGKIKKEDIVTASQKASEMGGSQIWLECGEQMTVDDMLKAILVVSANDCTVAMAEHIAGSEESFVALMNEKAKVLCMKNTNFVNSTGLPVDNHYSCARDIAIMTRELLKYEDVFKYTTIWMDSLRNGEFGLSNTNKLIRFYPGANGMKTGFTDHAGYCLSGTAKRENMQLIASVMKADTSDKRFQDAKKLFDYGFANFSVYDIPSDIITPVRVTGGCSDTVRIEYHEGNGACLVPKGREGLVETVCDIPESLPAPINKGDTIGRIHFVLKGEEIMSLDIVASDNVEKIDFFGIISKMFSYITSFCR